MTSEWKITCSETNTKLLSKDDYNWPHEGIGIYAIDIPDKFYCDAQFSFVAHLDAPNSPNGMKCSVRYYKEFNCQPSSDCSFRQSCTIMIGYNRPFISGMTEKSSVNYINKLNYPSWKACLAIHFLIPVDMNSNKYVYPGKDWKLTLVFTFEDMQKNKERIELDKQKIRKEEEKKRRKKKLEN